ncbi:MAG: diguanylate cyclase [Sulfurimonadaceae bacterium]|nr:diguanylate cyclase [Sulfurimonadaceae bacterium]
MTDKEGLKLLTTKSMTMVREKEIVLPSTYRVLFSMLAKKNNIDIGAEYVHTNEEISDEVYKQIIAVDNNADRAIQAMENEDATELQKVIEDTRKLKQELEALKRIAYEDGLTKALNRKWLEENYLEQETETFKKDGVLALIDLNDFKIINDSLGHAVGDKVLVHLANRLKKLDAHVVRYGGDEFVIIFDEQSPQEVNDLINVIRELYLKKSYRIMDHDLKIKFAYGISTFKTDDKFSDIIHLADEQLYDDKAKVKARTGQ